jgi:hypothetical protein
MLKEKIIVFHRYNDKIVRSLKNQPTLTLLYFLKRQCHEIFDPRFFSLNCTPGSPDSWVKTVLHIDSNSRSYSTTKIDSALCCIARSRFFFVR